MSILEAASAALVILAVWLIGRLDLRGQYLMAAAQVLWATVGALGRHWWLFAQSLILLSLTVKAVRQWRELGNRRQAK